MSVFLDSADGLRVEDLCVYSSTAEPGHIIDLQNHTGDSADIICCIKSGAATLRFDGAPLLPVEHTVLFPHKPEYSLIFTKKSAFILLSFRLFRMEERIVPPRELSLTAPLRQEFERLEETVACAGASGSLQRKAAFFAILAKCTAQLSALFSPGFGRIAPGVDALEAQYLANTPISEYAALCGLRENRFRLLFTEHYGMSPVEYRNTLRMRYAHALMNQFHCSVAEAAHAAGFASTSYFCRLHRKMFGVSPAGMEESDGKMDEME